MRVFAIGDLHLPGSQGKPMDVFGAHWERHFEKICEDWRARVLPEDVVLLPGDLSWAMTLEEAVERVLTLRDGGMRLKDAVRQVAADTGLSKNELYSAALER